MTRNHNLNTPSRGTAEWDVPMNENFEMLDSKVEIRDTESNLDAYEPKLGAKFFATDTESVFVGDGTGWSKVDSAGRNPRFDSIDSSRVNNVVDARNLDGADLGEQVENALAIVEGTGGRIRVTAPDDGQSLEWATDVVVDPTKYRGLDLDVDSNVVVEYTGSGVPLTLSPESTGYASDDTKVRIDGGIWRHAGTDPDGWLRIIDTYGTQVTPTTVQFESSSGDAFGVSIENHENWSESTYVGHCRIEADVCIDTKPASVTGGSGTESHHETYIENVDTRGTKIGIRMRGNWDFSAIHRTTMKAGAAGWTGLFIDTKFSRGCTIISPKFEDNGGRADTTGINCGEVYWKQGSFYAPLILNPHFEAVDTEYGDGQDDGNLISMETHRYGLRIREMSGGEELYWSGKHGALATTALDVRSIGNASKGWQAYHDGSGGHPEGPAYYDGSDWRSVVDGGVIS